MKKTKKKKSNFVDNTPRKLYFAYGSNMDKERLENRVGPVTKISKFIIHGFKLVFNCGIKDQFFANMKMTGKHEDFVEGVLYELSDYQFSLLDGYEGCPWCYQKFIFQHKGDNIYIYICINPDYTPKEPNAVVKKEYLNYLYKGCIDNRLMHTYKTLIEQFGEILVNS